MNVEMVAQWQLAASAKANACHHTAAIWPTASASEVRPAFVAARQHLVERLCETHGAQHDVIGICHFGIAPLAEKRASCDSLVKLSDYAISFVLSDPAQLP